MRLLLDRFAIESHPSTALRVTEKRKDWMLDQVQHDVYEKTPDP